MAAVRYWQVSTREAPGMISQLLNLVEQPVQHFFPALILDAELVQR